MTDVAEVVERLREYTAMLKEDCAKAAYIPPDHVQFCDQAADLLTAQQARIEGMEAALRRIENLPGCSGELEAYRCQQDMRLIEQARTIARATISER